MLVLSRNKEESILIGKDIKITVIDVRGQKVRLGIKAPENVIILREELVDDANKLDASS